jgi:protein TonB
MHRTVLAAAHLLLFAGPAIAEAPDVEPPLSTPRPTFQACIRPEYPPDALRWGEEGTTTFAFLVPAGDGAPEIRLIRSSGSARLDAGALRIAGKCLAIPEIRADLGAGRWYRQSIEWVLQ